MLSGFSKVTQGGAELGVLNLHTSRLTTPSENLPGIFPRGSFWRLQRRVTPVALPDFAFCAFWHRASLCLNQGAKGVSAYHRPPRVSRASSDLG